MHARICQLEISRKKWSECSWCWNFLVHRWGGLAMV